MYDDSSIPSLPSSIRQSYEQKDAVRRLSAWYNDIKEQAFLEYLLRFCEFPSQGEIVEIGGGAGIHGRILDGTLSQRYLHTDYSNALVEAAESLGLRSRLVDGLEMPFPDGSVSGLVLIGTSTIIRSEPVRYRQFAECARTLSPNGLAVFVTTRMGRRRGLHSLCRSDLAELQSLGLILKLYSTWGLIPGRYWRNWNRRLFGCAEELFSFLGLGIRRITIVRKVVLQQI